MIKRPASRLHIVVLHKLLHIGLGAGRVSQAENGVCTWFAETVSSILDAVGPKKSGTLGPRNFCRFLSATKFSPKR